MAAKQAGPVKQEPVATWKNEDFINKVASIKKRYLRKPWDLDEEEYELTAEEFEELQDPDIARILPNLYISKGQISIDPAALQEHQVTSILSITTDFQPEWESPAIKKLVPIQRHLLLPADDNKVMNLLPFFASICDWIDEQIETPTTAVSNGMGDGGKNNVLVHCKAGFSRSPTICIAYLLRKMYPTHDPERDPSFEEILTDFSKTKWSRTWPKETSTFLDQLKVWFATGYQIWEDDEKRIPKKEYQRFLEKVRAPELKALQEVWKEVTGEESGWEDDQLGLTVVGVKEHCGGNVRKVTWEEAKEIMQKIPEEKTVMEREKTISWYVVLLEERTKRLDSGGVDVCGFGTLHGIL